MLSTSTSRVAIVGGGLAGLAAGISAARAGADVTLFERSKTLGGRAETHVEQGFHFNIGPHAVFHDSFELLRGLGVELTGGNPPLGRTVAWYRGKRYRLPLGGASMLATGLLGVRHKIEAGKFFATRLRHDPAPLSSVTVRDWLDSSFSPGPVRDLIETFVRVSTYSNAPEIASAGAALEQMQVAGSHPVFYVDGGWQTIVDQLRDQFIAAGGSIQGSTRVTAVEPRPAGGWRLHTAADGSRDAGAVIIASGPTDASRLLTGAPGAVLQRWAKQSTPVRAAVLDIGLSRIPIPQVNYSIGIDRPLYFSVHTKVAKLAPGGGAVIHAAMYLDPAIDHDPGAIQRELEELADRVQPGWRELVVHSRFLPDMAVTNAVVDAARGGFSGRPGPEVPGAPGLFVAGDWVGPAGMLASAALRSGLSAGSLAANVPAAAPALASPV